MRDENSLLPGERRILLLEESRHWEAELRRRIPDSELRLIVCRSASEVRAELSSDVGGFICAMTPLSGEQLLLLSEIVEHRRTDGIVVLLSEDDLELEWVVREMGVTAVLEDRYSSAIRLEEYCGILGKSKIEGIPVR